jgi:anti-sigma-K factor RskA
VSRHRTEHLELCAAWALGSIDESDRLELEGHLADGCDICRAEIAALEEGRLRLAASAEPDAPSPSVRAATLARVRAAMAEAGRDKAAREVTSPIVLEPKLRPRHTRSAGTWFRFGLAAASVALAIGILTLWNSRERIRHELARDQEALAGLQRALETERSWTRILASKDARAVEFSATPNAASALRARGIWDPSSRRALLVFELPATPPDRDYQLWGLHPSGPASLGLVRADASGRSVIRLEDAGDPGSLQAFAVSLEPRGGSPNPHAPSGPVLMVGKIGG